MNDKMPALWFGIYGKKYEGKEPAFFEENDLPWVEKLKEIYPILKDKLQPLMQEDNSHFTPYFDEKLQFPPNNWKTLHFYFWGWKSHAHLSKAPVMRELEKKIPGLISASLSLLEPHSRILPHSGDTNAIYRVHMGLRIPTGLPQCGFVVKGEARPWKEGGVLTFLDSNIHEAFNESAMRRYIMTLDIIRPEFSTRKNYVCLKMLSILSLYKIEASTRIFSTILNKVSGSQPESGRHIPKWLIDVLLFPLMVAWFFFLPLHNFFYVRGMLGRKQT